MGKNSISSAANNAAMQLQRLANEATEKSFQYNSAEAATNRAWQKEMSDTSHQREVADLKKAGLNPVLSANQGAMSYTSSSASAQAESGANAAASVYGSEISGMAQISATKAAAAAQLKAAKISAAATRAAAASSAAAAKYQADMHYASNKYAWDTKDKLERDSWKQKPVSSVFGLADKKLFGDSNLGSKVINLLNAMSKKDLGTYFSKYNGKNNFTLNHAGNQKMGQMCNWLGIANNQTNRNLCMKLSFGNSSAYAQINNLRRQRNRS